VCFNLYETHQSKSDANPINWQCSGCMGKDNAENFNSTTKCNDGRDETFFDKCQGGFCTGEPDTCLRDVRQNNDLTLDCEIPKNDKCNLKDGASNYYVNGARKCGCTIGGVTYHHLQENPGNRCAHCDVKTKNYTQWSYKSQACDDNDLWTHSDVCRPTAPSTPGKPAGGHCRGDGSDVSVSGGSAYR
jgi:hypothetical protein